MTATQQPNSTASFENVYEQVRDSREQFLAFARKAGNAYLDSYEKAVDRTVDLERKFAASTQQEWIKDLIEAQTAFAREVASSYTSTARTLLK
jgi:hypothetical protein